MCLNLAKQWRQSVFKSSHCFCLNEQNWANQPFVVIQLCIDVVTVLPLKSAQTKVCCSVLTSNFPDWQSKMHQTTMKDRQDVWSPAYFFIWLQAAHLSLPSLHTSRISISLCELNWAQMLQRLCSSVSCFMLLWKRWLPDCSRDEKCC